MSRGDSGSPGDPGRVKETTSPPPPVFSTTTCPLPRAVRLAFRFALERDTTRRRRRGHGYPRGAQVPRLVVPDRGADSTSSWAPGTSRCYSSTCGGGQTPEGSSRRHIIPAGQSRNRGAGAARRSRRARAPRPPPQPRAVHRRLGASGTGHVKGHVSPASPPSPRPPAVPVQAMSTARPRRGSCSPRLRGRPPPRRFAAGDVAAARGSSSSGGRVIPDLPYFRSEDVQSASRRRASRLSR